MNKIYLDIETVASADAWVRDYVSSTVTHPGQMKKPETIAKWELEDKPGAVEEAMDKCSFDGAMNQIVCIGLAINDAKPEMLVGDESKILQDFYAIAQNDGTGAQWVGHNISAFDLRVIRQRSIVLGIKPPNWFVTVFNAKPWDSERIWDTMIQWDAKTFVKLDKLARAFGIKGKSSDGSQVAQLWRDGNIQAIAEYCANDVELTRKIFLRMTHGD